MTPGAGFNSQEVTLPFRYSFSQVVCLLRELGFFPELLNTLTDAPRAWVPRLRRPPGNPQGVLALARGRDYELSVARGKSVQALESLQVQISARPCVLWANHPRSLGLPPRIGKTGLVCNYLTASWRTELVRTCRVTGTRETLHKRQQPRNKPKSQPAHVIWILKTRPQVRLWKA